MDVIVPTNGKRINQLEECLASLAAQTFQVNVVVVLGTKHFEESKKVRELCEKYAYTLLHEPVKHAKGSHRAIACNHGLHNTHSSVVAFVDDDTVVPARWAEVSAKYLFGHDSIAGVTSGCTSSLSHFHRIQKIGSDSHAQCFDTLMSVQSLPGYNAVYRRKVIERVGEFNEDIGGCEDWELNQRIRNAQWLLLGIPEVPVEHRHTYTWHSFAKQMFGYGWSRARLVRVKRTVTIKHSLPALYLLVFPILFVVGDIESVLLLLGVYAVLLALASVCVDAIATKTFWKTMCAFVVMHISWALGYLKGLIA